MLFLFSVVGAVLVLEGMPYFAFPSKVKQWGAAMQDASDSALRIMGIISIAAGLVIIYLVRFFSL